MGLYFCMMHAACKPALVRVRVDEIAYILSCVSGWVGVCFHIQWAPFRLSSPISILAEQRCSTFNASTMCCTVSHWIMPRTTSHTHAADPWRSPGGQMYIFSRERHNPLSLPQLTAMSLLWLTKSMKLSNRSKSGNNQRKLHFSAAKNTTQREDHVC